MYSIIVHIFKNKFLILDPLCDFWNWNFKKGILGILFLGTNWLSLALYLQYRKSRKVQSLPSAAAILKA